MGFPLIFNVTLIEESSILSKGDGTGMTYLFCVQQFVVGKNEDNKFIEAAIDVVDCGEIYPNIWQTRRFFLQKAR